MRDNCQLSIINYHLSIAPIWYNKLYILLKLVIIIKRHKYYLLLISCFVLLMCFGCTNNADKVSNADSVNNKDINSEADKLKDKLIGKWEWQKTSGGLANKTYTPEESGYTMQLIFKKDNTYELYKNGKSEARGTYEIKKKKVITGREDFVVDYTNRPDEVISLSDNNLSLSQDVYDGQQYVYRKVN